jgi:hypothetical protein
MLTHPPLNDVGDHLCRSDDIDFAVITPRELIRSETFDTKPMARLPDDSDPDHRAIEAPGQTCD